MKSTCARQEKMSTPINSNLTMSWEEPYLLALRKLGMEQGKLVAICQLGGEFGTNSDGTISYAGGEAHAIDVDREMKLQDFKAEIENMFSCDTSPFIIKYLLPSNRKTLITISNDKDLQRMVDFCAGSITTDVFLVTKIEKKTTMCLTVANVEVPTDVLTDTCLATSAALVPFATPESNKRPKVSDGWERLITGVGQAFDSIKEFRDALHKYAIGKGFAYKFIKNDGTRVTAECTGEDCPWRIHASMTSPKNKILIKTLNDVHTCEGSQKKDSHRLAKQKWVASVIKDKLRESPNYKPRDIANDFQRDYGLNLNYTQAWRGKYLAKKELLNSDEEVVGQLPWFCERILETNPGSVASLVTTEDSRFDRIFVAFHASLNGFEQGCRPLLYLDGIPLKVTRQWKLLTATSVDSENESFPVAFAIVLIENEENWVWFLGQLNSVLSVSRTLTFVSNRENGLADAVPQVFEDSFHGHDSSHLIEEFRTKLEELLVEESWTDEVKESMVDDLKHAAYAYKPDEFNECLENIKNVSKEAAEWILDSKPELWSTASFKGLRYDNLSSNASEQFNTWLGKVGRQEPSVIQMIDWIRCKIMEMMYTRRESSNAWAEILTPSAHQRLQQESEKSCTLEVISSSGNVFEVRDPAINVVNIETWECTCRKWQVTGLPCMHAIAVFERTNRSLFEYCSKYFTTECYRLTYALSINPIPDVGRPLSGDSPHMAIKYPIRTPRRPGRPKQSPSEPQKIISKRTVQCSKCKEYGHNKATCKTSP